MNYLVTNIKWDTDGEEVDLPTRVLFLNGNDNFNLAQSKISDMLSDVYGFCHFSFEIDNAPDLWKISIPKNIVDLEKTRG